VKFEREILNCLASREWDLGICACVNHDPYISREITFEYAAELLKTEPARIEILSDENEITIKVVRKTRENLQGDVIEDDTIYITISRR